MPIKFLTYIYHFSDLDHAGGW